MKLINPFYRRALLILLVAVLATACTAAPAAAPTADLNAVRTEAVQTAVANFTLQAAMNPSATPTALPTLPPTATTTLTATATLKPAATSAPTSAGGGVFVPTRTPSGLDVASLVSQSPADYKFFKPGEAFDCAWTFKNIGKQTWTATGYSIQYASGTELSTITRLPVSADVAVGASTSFKANCLAPQTPGNYISYWHFLNTAGSSFYQFYLVISVK